MNTINLQKHGNIKPIQGDVINKSDLDRAVSIVKESHGHVNVVIANAGIGGPSLHSLPDSPDISEFREHLWSWSSESFTETFQVNTTGVFNTAAAFLGLLDEGNKRGNLKQKSQIIATSSIGAFNRSPLLGYAYGGSKAAVVHIFKQLSTSLVPYGIRANVIAPGCEFFHKEDISLLISFLVYPSEMTQQVIEKRKETGWPKDLIPEQRPGDEQDIAGAVLFLVSAAGAYINGNVLITDGGRLGVVPASY